MDEKRIRIILKSGNEFFVTCKSFECQYSKISGDLISISYEKPTENIPLYLDIAQVSAVLQERP